jgi:hypothetical protein
MFLKVGFSFFWIPGDTHPLTRYLQMFPLEDTAFHLRAAG